MTGTKTAALPAVHVGSLLFICALLPALLFKGPNVEFFAITQIVLVLWLGWILLHSYKSGLRIPRTALAALSLSPKLFQTRLDYANLLLQQGRRREAHALLEEGIRYEYYPMPELIPLYKLAAGLRREAGRTEEARILEDKAGELEKMTTAAYRLRGY